MKTLIKKTVFILTIALGLNMSAADFKVSVNKDNTVTISLDKLDTDTSITLKDYKGNMIYNGTFNKQTQHLNLQELPDGMYFIVVDDTYKVEESTIVKENNSLKIMSEEKIIVFKPSFKVKGKFVRMSLTNPEQKMATFTVYNEQGTVVGKATGKDLVIKKTFDFSKGKYSDFVIETQIGDHRFTKMLSVN